MLTRDDIISLALAYRCDVEESLSVPGAGFKVWPDGSIAELLEAVAAAAYAASREAATAEAVAAEREACAKLVRHLRDSVRAIGVVPGAYKDALDQAEAAIRARGAKGAKA